MKKLLSLILVLVWFFSTGITYSAKKVIAIKNIAVKGIMCQTCVGKVKSALLKIKGIKKVKINAKNGDTKVYFKNKVNIKDEALLKAIKDAGFEGTIKTTKKNKN